MNFLTIINTVKDKLPKLPGPFAFLNRVISSEHPERASAFLAVASGIALIIGYIAMIIAITRYDKKLTTEFIAINAAIVSLATFSPVDRKPNTVIPSKISKPEDKETLQG